MESMTQTTGVWMVADPSGKFPVTLTATEKHRHLNHYIRDPSVGTGDNS